GRARDLERGRLAGAAAALRALAVGRGRERERAVLALPEVARDAHGPVRDGLGERAGDVAHGAGSERRRARRRERSLDELRVALVGVVALEREGSRARLRQAAVAVDVVLPGVGSAEAA